METIKVYLNDKDIQKRVVGKMVVEAELLEDRKTTVLVKLPDGNVITRKKKTQVVQEEKSNG